MLRLIAGMTSQFAVGSLRLHSHQDVHILLSTPRHLATHDLVFTGDIILASPSKFDVIAAAASQDVNLSFIMAVQMARFLFVLLAGPPISRMVARWAGG